MEFLTRRLGNEHRHHCLATLGLFPPVRCSNQESILTPPSVSLSIPFGRFILNEILLSSSPASALHRLRLQYRVLGTREEGPVASSVG